MRVRVRPQPNTTPPPTHTFIHDPPPFPPTHPHTRGKFIGRQVGKERSGVSTGEGREGSEGVGEDSRTSEHNDHRHTLH